MNDFDYINWFLGSALEPISRGSASLAHGGKLEAQPPDMRYQGEPGNESNNTVNTQHSTLNTQQFKNHGKFATKKPQ